MENKAPDKEGNISIRDRDHDFATGPLAAAPKEAESEVKKEEPVIADVLDEE